MPLISLMALLGLIIGLAAERKGFASNRWKRLVSRALIQVFYPCLIFSSLLFRFHWEEVLSLALLPWLFLVGLVAGLIYGRLTLAHSGLENETSRRSYAFLSIMPNYSYVPLVVAQIIWGERGLALVAMTSVAADISLWTFAYAQISGKRDWKKIFSPAFLSILLAFALLYACPDRSAPAWTNTLAAISWIGKATLPLSMYVLGVQLARASRPGRDLKAHSLLALWRLILCPALTLLLITLFAQGLPYEAQALLLLASSMPGAVVTVVLAQLHDADGEFAATQILLGHGLALLTVPSFQGILFLLN